MKKNNYKPSLKIFINKGWQEQKEDRKLIKIEVYSFSMRQSFFFPKRGPSVQQL